MTRKIKIMELLEQKKKSLHFLVKNPRSCRSYHCNFVRFQSNIPISQNGFFPFPTIFVD